MQKLRRALAAAVALSTGGLGALPAAAARAADTRLRPPVAYVAVQGPCCGHGSIVKVPVAGGVAEATIAVGGTPTDVAITPDANKVLVPNRYGYVSVIDTVTSEFTQIPVCTFVGGIAITPDGTTALVTCVNDATVLPIDIATGQVGAPISVGAYPNLPYSIAISPDGSTAYVVNFNGVSPSDPIGVVIPVSIATRAVGAPIRLSEREAIGAAITPDGRTLAVGWWGNTVTGSGVDLIDTTTRTVKATAHVPAGPNSIAITSDGARAYVACRVDYAIAPISLVSGTPPPTRRGVGAWGLALTPDGKTLFSANGGGLLEILDPETLQTRGYVSTDSNPVAVAVTPDQAPQASLALVRRRHRKKVTLDASSSFAPSTPIVSYAWDFGDGTNERTTTPRIVHRYRRRGIYEVRVTLTDAAGTSTQQVFTGQTVSRNGGLTATATLRVSTK